MTPLSPASIVSMLRSQDCTVELDTGGLVITAPKGHLTDGAKQVILTHKADIETYLRPTDPVAKSDQPATTLTGQADSDREIALISILPSPVRQTVHRLKAMFTDLGDGLTLIETHRRPETLSADLSVCKEEG